VQNLALVEATARSQVATSWQPEDGEHHRAATLHDLAGVAASAVRIGAMGGQLLEVMPGREGVPMRRDHHRADALVRAEAFELLR